MDDRLTSVISLNHEGETLIEMQTSTLLLNKGCLVSTQQFTNVNQI